MDGRDYVEFRNDYTPHIPGRLRWADPMNQMIDQAIQLAKGAADEKLSLLSVGIKQGERDAIAWRKTRENRNDTIPLATESQMKLLETLLSDSRFAQLTGAELNVVDANRAI